MFRAAISAAALSWWTTVALAQSPAPIAAEPSVPARTSAAPTEYVISPMTGLFAESETNGFLNGTHRFDRFIGFMSNPLQNIDPRSLTTVWPIFMSNWVNGSRAIPDGDIQLYGAGLNIALTDRLSIGMNQGGYAVADFDRNQRGQFRDHLRRIRDKRENSGERSGWLNLGGFIQYTVIADEENQFILTGGLRWEAPSGQSEVFQGYGPPQLAPYLTVGKELGNFHILFTTGYEFPAGSGDLNNNFFNANLHIDRQFFGWLYPLVELNGIVHTTDVEFSRATRRGFIDFGTFSSSGNLVALAAGANAVIVPNRIELGAVYTTSIATERDFGFDGLIVKMTYRY